MVRINIKPFEIKDTEMARLEREMKGNLTKVLAIKIDVEYYGKLTQQQIADMLGIARMTLYRWKRYDYIFEYELERQHELRSEHYRKESRKLSDRRRISASAILGDEAYLRMALGLSN
ncbi:helix-turn-helix domain-containing protein [Lysinibacillus sp. CD3-6]|uniref:phBC6A51 family helix-turn-helix protein n=1 Tax=Lysinibacillus sp. CD3-6 TaxID=2892541 RepID=UPI00111DD90C|nr:phBC6A51 family helix-turn-helix protein [Lysinibacillus sp. CD3-6]UED78735.1 helix-turn-helix domain-containing protein [Lysinibacillus sp. CD3-6]